MTATDKLGHGSSIVFEAQKFGNFAGSIYELVVLPDDTVLAPVMKYEEGKNVASLWYLQDQKWTLLMIFESLPGAGERYFRYCRPRQKWFCFVNRF